MENWAELKWEILAIGINLLPLCILAGIGAYFMNQFKTWKKDEN